MKKWIIVAGSILLLLAAGIIYLFIPSNFSVSYHLRVACNARGGVRVVADSANWGKWLPREGVAFSYRPSGPYNFITNIRIENKEGGVISRMLLVPSANPDTSDLYWDMELITGRNPLRRVGNYFFGRAVSRDMGNVLPPLKDFLEKKENVYGLDIQGGTTKDSFLIATRAIFATDPSIGDIYGLLNALELWVKKEGARETGYPMLNITRLGDGRRQMELALPVDRKMKDVGVFYTRKLVPGHYLVTEVKGGTAMLDHGLSQMQQYIEDYQRTTMAIPFQSLITDRSKEPDTSRWITRIYYPVY